MNKIGYYLQEHVAGEVVTSVDARRHFSTDNSIFSLNPALVLYPRNENDIRKTTRFAWQLAERNRIVPITARGSGTDQTGAAIGSGIIIAFPAHMHRIMELDAKNGIVIVEPGINFGKLQQALQTHGHFLPPFPLSFEYSTVGGAVANNASGDKNLKYGDLRQYVQSLRVVLANGEVIITEQLNKRELSKKLGLTTFEGEIYRSLDTMLEEHRTTIEQLGRNVVTNSAGYDLLGIKTSEDSFNLTPLFVGSQGTLGIITEITLETELHNPETVMIVASFDDLNKLQSAVLELRKIKDLPSTEEVIDGNLLALVDSLNPNQLKDAIAKPFPKYVLLVEYDDSARHQKKNSKEAEKVLKKYAQDLQVESEFAKKEILSKIKQASAMASAHVNGNSRAIPVMEGGSVPVENFEAFMAGVQSICEKNHIQPAIWGQAGETTLYVRPYLDLEQIGDRQKAFRVMDQYYDLIIRLGGTISGASSDGRLRAPYLKKMYGDEAYDLFQKVKKIFDPYGILNPGVKVGVSIDDLKPLIRSQYTINHLYDHLPRT